jgi:hypothetical protein
VQILLISVGLFTVAGGVFGWEWFLGHWKSRLFVKMFGRNGARAFYIIFGLAVAGLGVLLSVMLDGG